MTPTTSSLPRTVPAPRTALIDLNQPPRRRRRYGRPEKEALLAAFGRSGLTAAQFCRTHGLHPATFCSWQKIRRAGASSFAEVRVTGPASPVVTGAAITIYLRQEVCVEVPVGLDPVWLGRVLQVLTAEA